MTSRATHAQPTSPRSTGFCAIWDCISSSSSSRTESKSDDLSFLLFGRENLGRKTRSKTGRGFSDPCTQNCLKYNAPGSGPSPDSCAGKGRAGRHEHLVSCLAWRRPGRCRQAPVCSQLRWLLRLATQRLGLGPRNSHDLCRLGPRRLSLRHAAAITCAASASAALSSTPRRASAWNSACAAAAASAF